MTMNLIQHQELGSAQASVTFSNIPQSYTDLCLVYSLRTDRAATDDSVLIRFNGVSANLSARELRGTGSGVNSNTFSVGFCGFVNGASSTSSTFSSQSIYIPNYANGNNKSFSVDGVFENNATSALQGILAGLWSQTNAITSITLVPDVGPNFVQYSSATLYGITKGSSNGTVVS